MNSAKIINDWFEKWVSGDFTNLPIAESFKHTSPFGVMDGKDFYLNMVKENKEKFLGYTFQIHDQIIGHDSACVRYTAMQGDDFKLDVSEWFYFSDNLIQEIVSYYHIGEIREERRLSS